MPGRIAGAKDEWGIDLRVGRVGRGGRQVLRAGGAMVSVTWDEDSGCAVMPEVDAGAGVASSPGCARCTAGGRSFSETVGAGTAALIAGICGGGQPQSSGTVVSIWFSFPE